jgi:hypothetical protein
MCFDREILSGAGKAKRNAVLKEDFLRYNE